MYYSQGANRDPISGINHLPHKQTDNITESTQQTESKIEKVANSLILKQAEADTSSHNASKPKTNCT